MNMLFAKNTIIRLLSIAILSSVAIAFSLWSNQNDFIQVGFSLGIEPYLLVFASLATIFCFPKKRYLYIIFFLVLIICCAANFTRIQIWLFHLAGLLILIGLGKNEKDVNNLLRLGIAAAYFWGGINKINPWFAEFQLEWLLEKPDFLQLFGTSKAVGYSIAFFELLLSILLLTKRLPKLALFFSVIFHAFILLMISPFGKNWNYVVVPWNVALLLFNFYLYYDKENSYAYQFKNQATIALMLCFFAFPALQYSQLGQYPLSFNMYAATQPELTLFFHESDENKIPLNIREHQYSLEGGKSKIRLLKLQDWSMNSVNVPAYSEVWALEAYAKNFCKCLSKPDSASVELLTVERFDMKKTTIRKIPCKDFKK